MSNKKTEIPGALTLEWCKEAFGEQGRAVYNAVAQAGGFGSFREANPPSLDLTGLDGEYKSAVENVLNVSTAKEGNK